MTKILATPYERGNADQIVSRKYTEKVLEGLAVYETNDGMKLLTSGHNPTLFLLIAPISSNVFIIR